MAQTQKREITAAEEAFCQHLVLHSNKAAAYRHAYPERAGGRSDKRIAVAASQVASKPRVQARTAELRASLASRVENHFEITSDWIIQRLAAIADANIDHFLVDGPDGLPRIDLGKANAAARRGLVALKVNRTERAEEPGDGEEALAAVEVAIDIKITTDRLGALKLLGQHIKMFKQDDAANVNVNIGDLMTRGLERARARRVAKPVSGSG